MSHRAPRVAGRSGIDARVSFALQAQAVLQLAEAPVGIVRRLREGLPDQPQARSELQQREIADVAGQLLMRPRVAQHQVLHDDSTSMMPPRSCLRSNSGCGWGGVQHLMAHRCDIPADPADPLLAQDFHAEPLDSAPLPALPRRSGRG